MRGIGWWCCEDCERDVIASIARSLFKQTSTAPTNFAMSCVFLRVSAGRAVMVGSFSRWIQLVAMLCYQLERTR